MTGRYQRVEWRAELRCLMCARAAGYTTQQHVRIHLFRCRACGGSLYRLPPERHVEYLRMPRMANPGPGRPPGPPATYARCENCEQKRAKTGRRVCTACAPILGAEQRRAREADRQKVLSALAAGATTTAHIAAGVGLPNVRVTRLIRELIDRGEPIVTVGQRYRLGSAS